MTEVVRGARRRRAGPELRGRARDRCSTTSRPSSGSACSTTPGSRIGTALGVTEDDRPEFDPTTRVRVGAVYDWLTQLHRARHAAARRDRRGRHRRPELARCARLARSGGSRASLYPGIGMQLAQSPDPPTVARPARGGGRAVRRRRRARCAARPTRCRLALVALLSGGHLLVEGVPGTGKTLLAKSLAAAIGGRFGRVQCTPDLLPADVTGTSVYGPATGEWEFRPGPGVRERRARRRGEPRVAAHAGRAARADGGAPGHDRRRDAPAARIRSSSSRPRTRSAARARSRCPRASSTGSRSCARSGCPGRDAEREILDGDGRRRRARRASRRSRPRPSSPRRSPRCGSVHCAHTVLDYVLDVADATRNHPGVALGASPRASLSLLHAAQAHATVMGRDFVSPDDVKAVASGVLAHRIVLANGVDVAAGCAGRRRDRRRGRRRRVRDAVAVIGTRRVRDAASGPGDLTLTSIVLFTLGAYGVAAGAATGEQSGRRGRRVRVHAVRRRDRLADRRARAARRRRRGRRPTRRSATPSTLHVRAHGRAPRVDVRALDPPGDVVAHRGAGRRGRSRTSRPGAACSASVRVAAAHVGAARRVRAHADAARRAARRRSRSRPRPSVGAPRSATDPRRTASPRVPPLLARRAATRCARCGRTSPGDPARLVHWPTSARRGELVVREHEPPPRARRRARRRSARRPRCREDGREPRGGHRARDARRRRRRLVLHVRSAAARSSRWSPTRATSAAGSRAAAPARPGDAARRLAGRDGASTREAGAAEPPARRGARLAVADRRGPGRDRARRGRRDRRRAERATRRGSSARWPARSPALLGVLALPSLPTRRVAVVLLGARRPRRAAPRVVRGHRLAAGCSSCGRRPRWSRSCSSTGPTPRRCAPLPRGRAAPGRAGETSRVGVVDRGGRDRGRPRRRARADDHRPPRPPRVARARPDVRRRVERAVVAALDRRARHDHAAAPLRPRRVHRRRAARRLLARRDLRRVGRRTRGRSRDPQPTPLVHDGDKVAVTPAPDDVGARRRRRRSARRSTSRRGFSDVVFAAPSPVVGRDRQAARASAPDGTRRSAFGRVRQGRGLHRHEPERCSPTAALLRASRRTPIPAAVLDAVRADRRTTTDRVRALARPITAGAPTTYDKVHAIEAWLGANTKYSLNAPLVAARASTSSTTSCSARRVGWCEQIASSLVVLARSVGIPARLVDRLRARARATRSPGGSSCASATRTRGPRSTSRASAGRASTRPRRCRSPATRAASGSWLQPTRATTRSRSACSRPSLVLVVRSARPRSLARVAAPAARAGVVELATRSLHRLERIGPQGGPGPRAGRDAARVRGGAGRSASRDDRLARGRRHARRRRVLGRAARRASARADADAVLSSL